MRLFRRNRATAKHLPFRRAARERVMRPHQQTVTLGLDPRVHTKGPSGTSAAKGNASEWIPDQVRDDARGQALFQPEPVA